VDLISVEFCTARAGGFCPV